MSDMKKKIDNFYAEAIGAYGDFQKEVADTKKKNNAKYNKVKDETVLLEDVFNEAVYGMDEYAEKLYGTPKRKKKVVNEGYKKSDKGWVDENNSLVDDSDDDGDSGEGGGYPPSAEYLKKYAGKPAQTTIAIKKSILNSVKNMTNDSAKKLYNIIQNTFNEDVQSDLFGNDDPEEFNSRDKEIDQATDTDDMDEMDKADEILETIDLSVLDNATRLELIRSIIDSAQNSSIDRTDGEEADEESVMDFDEFVEEIKNVIEEFQYEEEPESDEIGDDEDFNFDDEGSEEESEDGESDDVEFEDEGEEPESDEDEDDDFNFDDEEESEDETEEDEDK